MMGKWQGILLSQKITSQRPLGGMTAKSIQLIKIYICYQSKLSQQDDMPESGPRDFTQNYTNIAASHYTRKTNRKIIHLTVTDTKNSQITYLVKIICLVMQKYK